MSARPVTSKAAAASRKRDLSADDIANLIQPVALDLLGEPNRALSSRHELRFGNNGSLAVTIAGERAGQWYSFEDGRGGGVLDLIVRERGGTRAQAMHWLKSRPYAPKGASSCKRPAQPRKARSVPAQPRTPGNTDSRMEMPTGAGEETPEGQSDTDATPAPADAATGAALSDALGPPPWQQGKDLEAEPDTRAEALRLWREAWPVDGTPAALYLRSRGIDPLKLMRLDLPGSWPDTLRYSTAHPGIALIVAVHDARTGLICAIQRIFLTREGRAVRESDVCPNVAPEADKKIKRSLGPIDGNAARFSSWPDPAGRWGIAEGPETALAAQQLLGFPVWSAIHAGNMAKVDPPYWASQAFVVADHDDGGMEAATATAIRLSEMPSIHRVQIIRAVANKADMADVLKESA